MNLAPPPAGTDPGTSGPPPPGPAVVGPLRGDRVVAGVAGDLAARLGVDALWVRLAFVLLALAGGIGVVVYAGLWLVLVRGVSSATPWPRLAGGAIIVVGVPLLLAAADGEFYTGPFAVVLLLVGLTLALWQPRSAAGGGASAPAWTADDAAVRVPAVDLPPSGPSGLSGPAGSSGDGADRPPGSAPLPATAPRRPPREPSLLGRATFGLALVVAAAGALIDEGNGGRLHPEQWLGAAAVVCGLGLLVGAVRGHARWLILPALAFAATGYVGGVLAHVGVDPGDGIGDEYAYIGDGLGGGRWTEELAVGTLHLDIAAAPASPVTVDARVGFGRIRVSVAESVTVEVRPHVDHGEVRVDGLPHGESVVRIGTGDEPDVIVNARIGAGDVNIHEYGLAQPIDVPPFAPLPEIVVPGRPGAGPLTLVTDGVAVTSDGWFVLADGAAVIDADDVLVAGESYEAEGRTFVPTPYGDFQVLPRGLLITPFGELLDLRAVRAEVAPAPDVTGTATTMPADAPASDPPATTLAGGSAAGTPTTMPAGG